MTIQSPSGQRWEVSEVPGEPVLVCWFDAAPFHTIRVVWIQTLEAGSDDPFVG